MSAELLAPEVGRYVFVSTISVYKSLAQVGADEAAAVETVDDPTTEDVKTSYGALEGAVRARGGGGDAGARAGESGRG